MHNCRALTFFVFVFFQITAAAQTNYVQGFIVKLNGDTLRGYINDKSDKKNSKTIDFKPSLAGEATKYTPNDLMAYYFNTGKYYYSRTIMAEPAIEEKKFLEVLEQGKANLYFLKKDGNVHYYLEKDTAFFELTNEKKIVMIGTTPKLYNEKKYLRIMKELFSDCVIWGSDPQYYFEESDLKKAVRKYNLCGKTEEKKAESTRIKKEKVHFTLFAGLNISTANTSPNDVYLSNPDSRLLPAAGIAMNYVFPRTHKDISLQLGLNYNHKGAFSQPNNVQFDLQLIDFEVLLRYTYPKGKVRPFIGGGGVIGMLLNQQSAFTRDYYSPPVRYQLFYLNIPAYEAGYCLETGVFIPFGKRQTGLLLAARFEHTFMPVARTDVSTITNRIIQFRVGYMFK